MNTIFYIAVAAFAGSFAGSFAATCFVSRGYVSHAEFAELCEHFNLLQKAFVAHIYETRKKPI